MNAGLSDKKRDLIEDILKTQSDEEDVQELHIDPNKPITKMEFKKPEDYLQYTFHIPQSLESNSQLASKLFYVIDEAIADLSISKIFTTDFWLSLAVLILAAWIRAYLHSFGSWLFLVIAGVSVSTFSPMM